MDHKPSTSPLPKQKSASSPADDDEKWLDLIDPPTETEDYPKVPMQAKGAEGMGPFNPDPIFRVAPTAQHVLEAQLLHLAEVDLGVYNAVLILERHLVDKPEELNQSFDLSSSLGRPISCLPPVPGGNTRYQVYSHERSNANIMLKDIGFLLGLKKAVKILQAAVADPDRKDVKFKFKVPLPQNGTMSPPMPLSYVNGPPFQQAMPIQQPHYVSPMSMPTMQEQLRVIAKDIVKDTVKECKNEGGSTENVQQEMIKLLRDVCRDALQKKD